MVNNIKQIATSVLLKIALADGVLKEGELDLIEELSGGQAVDDLLKETRETDLDELLAQVNKPADRFFIRLRAQLMAESDGLVDEKEQEVLDKLVSKLSISPKLENLLADVLEHELEGTTNIEFIDVEKLYHQSSFASE